MELNQKLAVVTGVSKGLGLEVVKLLLDKGTVVAGWGRNQPSFTHPNFHFFSCDVAEEEQVEQAYQATVARLGADIRILINVASIAGLNGVSNFAGYVGTKHAVRGISHSLYMELRDFGIKVSTVYPGSIQTNFFDAIPGMDAHEHMMQPEDVALTIVQTLETHPNYFVVDVECRPLRPKGKK